MAYNYDAEKRNYLTARIAALNTEINDLNDVNARPDIRHILAEESHGRPVQEQNIDDAIAGLGQDINNEIETLQAELLVVNAEMDSNPILQTSTNLPQVRPLFRLVTPQGLQLRRLEIPPSSPQGPPPGYPHGGMKDKKRKQKRGKTNKRKYTKQNKSKYTKQNKSKKRVKHILKTQTFKQKQSTNKSCRIKRHIKPFASKMNIMKGGTLISADRYNPDHFWGTLIPPIQRNQIVIEMTRHVDSTTPNGGRLCVMIQDLIPAFENKPIESPKLMKEPDGNGYKIGDTVFFPRDDSELAKLESDQYEIARQQWNERSKIMCATLFLLGIISSKLDYDNSPFIIIAKGGLAAALVVSQSLSSDETQHVPVGDLDFNQWIYRLG